MISNYYVLFAISNEWRPKLVGTQIVDAYSQSADELSLVFQEPGVPSEKRLTLRMSTAAPLRYLLLSSGSGRAKRNTADVLASTIGAVVADVGVVSGDRILDIALEDSRRIQMVLFGSAANAFVVGDVPVDSSTETTAAPTILDAFQSQQQYVGKRVPIRPQTQIADADAFVARWTAEASGTQSCGQVIARIEPLFNRFMADEVVMRGGLAIKKRAVDVDEQAVRELFVGVQELRSLFLRQPQPTPLQSSPQQSAPLQSTPLPSEPQMSAPHQPQSQSAWIYWRHGKPERLALFESQQMTDCEAEVFSSVSEAVSVFVRRTLSGKSLADEHAPVLKKIASAKKRALRRVEELERELGEASRADRYERYGHILMAQPSAKASAGAPHSDPFSASDIFEGGEVLIPIDTNMTLIENANRYYEKAKSAKQARESAADRLSGATSEATRLSELFDLVAPVNSLDEWRDVVKDREEALRPFMESARNAAPEVPFRQFDLGSGYMVWVGKNAKQNELLSSKAARKFDLWFHARGVPGSHVLLRLPHRTAQPDGKIVEQAAQIAAYYSKARGGSMVPVIVAEAKYVRKPRGAAPGSVVVERERVLLVDPGLPG